MTPGPGWEARRPSTSIWSTRSHTAPDGRGDGAGPFLPAADDGLPLAPPPPEGHRDEPAVGGRRLRGDRGPVPVGLGPAAARVPVRGAHRGVRPDVPLLDPVRPVNGLRGLPDEPDARGIPENRFERAGGG